MPSARLETVVVEAPSTRHIPKEQPAQPIVGPQEANGQALFYRTLQPADLESLRSAHFLMLPVDYEETFFQRVVNGLDGVDNLAAVSRDAHGSEQLVGFVTSRSFRLYECDPVDRELLGLSHKLLDNEKLTYILTLGVSPAFRRKGIALSLIKWVTRQAEASKARAVFLHVISCNPEAIALYRKAGFSEIACRDEFYYIWNHRQPVAGQDYYDAFLYAVVFDVAINRSFGNMLILAIAPLRDVLYCLKSCLHFGAPPRAYFGGSELPAVSCKEARPKLKSSGSSSSSKTAGLPAWLLALFSRKEAVT